MAAWVIYSHQYEGGLALGFSPLPSLVEAKYSILCLANNRSLVVVNMESSLWPSSSDKCGNAEKIAPNVSTLAEDTSTVVAQETVLDWIKG